MTFIAPARPADLRSVPPFFGRRTAKPKVRVRGIDEDGARRALGLDHADGLLPVPGASAPSIEHLARIALG